MTQENMKERAESMGLKWRKDELEALPETKLWPGYANFNIPNPETPDSFDGESVWCWLDPESKAKYENDRYAGKLTAILCDNPKSYGGVLFDGIEVVIRCNRDKRPVLDPDWAQEKLIDSGLYAPRQDAEAETPIDQPEAICALALTTWGGAAQTFMVMEEMSKLQKELCKSVRGADNRDAIAEEIADVEIMLAQMKILHGCSESVEAFKLAKLKRLKARIAEAALKATKEEETA